MKILKLNQFNERLNIGKINIKDVKLHNYCPKTKEELKAIVEERIAKEGSNCDLNDIDTSQITDMSFLFDGTSFNGDISRWNVSNVTNMWCMFHRAHHFNKPIGNWNVSNVTNMCGMFNFAENFNQDISKWNVSNVTDMSHMFAAAESFNKDISNWNVSNVNDMTRMFSCAYKFNQDISKWNVSNVTSDLYFIFKDCGISSMHKPKFK